jgi:MOSC domain-containing protein YiiM
MLGIVVALYRYPVKALRGDNQMGIYCRVVTPGSIGAGTPIEA